MKIESYHDLAVYRTSFESAIEIQKKTESFPRWELYSMTDQIRRSSRSVCSAIGEAWRKRRYPLAFVSKLTDAESEAEETRVWLQFALRFGYLKPEDCERLDDQYDHVLRQLTIMIRNPHKWCKKV